MAENNSILYSRRSVLSALGMGALSSGSVYQATASPAEAIKTTAVKTAPAFSLLKSDISLKAGMIVETLGYFQPGDSGAAGYEIIQAPSGPFSEPVSNGLFARLMHNGYVSYRMFGAKCDGKSDDGVAIKKAHEYANQARIPVVNLSGEFWLKETRLIPVKTNTNWGNTVFHIDESFNLPGKAHFQILSHQQSFEITLTPSQKSSLIKQLRPGAELIPELAEYRNCLVVVRDENDRIGLRYGSNYNPHGWAREEFFYVEEHGRILGDIAWNFNEYTNLIAYPCDEDFLTVEGGTFLLSGDNPGKKGGPYHLEGIGVLRSRTIIRNQWVGLEKGRQDISLTPRSGFYSFRNVYDILLENIRLIPWEQDREGIERDVKDGTYGIGGSRVFCGTFRNITAEGGPVHWGVFGTNLFKNFRIENCRLNRVDVHFHGWNITIKDSEVGQKGLTLTGGGELLIENTRVFKNSFVDFRRDYGAKWDGPIRIMNCRLILQNGSDGSVISMHPGDFDYKYPVVFGHQIIVSDFVFVSEVSWNDAKYALILFPKFSQSEEGGRLIFPHDVEFSRIGVQGRERGVQIFNLPDISSFRVGNKKGGVSNGVVRTNSSFRFENIVLDDDPETPNFQLGLLRNYLDEQSLYPSVSIVNCDYLNAQMGDSIASVNIRGSLIRQFSAGKTGEFTGKVLFENCSFQAEVSQDTPEPHYRILSKAGISFSNCEINLPVRYGNPDPERLEAVDFLKINGLVRHNHLNTRLGPDLTAYLSGKNIKLKKEFIDMIKNHHELESEDV
jgi:hypothetical protein